MSNLVAQNNKNMQAITDFQKTIEQAKTAVNEFANTVNNILLAIHPQDLLSALCETSESEKQDLLDFYKRHEAYSHCDIIWKMMDAYSADIIVE